MIARAIPLALSLLSMLAGCAANEVRKQPWQDHEAALRTMAHRAQSLDTLSGRCHVTLRNAGGTVNLDGALAMRRPDHLRLRAWKFNQAVFDLTVNPEGIFLVAPQDVADAARADTLRGSAVRIARAWRIFTGDLFLDRNVLILDQRGPTFQIREAATDDTTILCTVDRATLTPVKYELLDAANAVRFTLRLERYRQFDNTVFPMRIIGQSDVGQFTIELADVEVNQPLPAAGFVPPSRAEKMP